MAYICLMTGRKVADCSRCRHRNQCAGVDLYHQSATGQWLAVDAGKLHVGRTKAEALESDVEAGNEGIAQMGGRQEWNARQGYIRHTTKDTSILARTMVSTGLICDSF